MNELQLGRMNSLPVAKQVDFGYYLEGTIRGRRTEVLLPTSEVDEAQPQPIETGTELEVFLYLDQEERLVATMHRPLAMVDEFAYLEVSWVNNFGAFLHWGPQKDLFVPFREQKMKMQKGHSYIVHLHIDPETYRIVASANMTTSCSAMSRQATASGPTYPRCAPTASSTLPCSPQAGGPSTTLPPSSSTI